MLPKLLIQATAVELSTFSLMCAADLYTAEQMTEVRKKQLVTQGD